MSDMETPPTGWGWTPDISPTDLDQMLATNNGRLVSLSVRSVSPRRLAAVWVEKSGDQADAAWSHDIDATALGETLNNSQARLTCLAPFVCNGAVRFTAAWIPNDGIDATDWSWSSDITASELEKTLSVDQARLTSFSSYVVNGTRHHAAVWVDNAGPRRIPWWWSPNVDEATLKRMLDDHSGRLVCLDPFIENGALRFGAAWIENTGPHARRWYCYHGVGPAAIEFKLDAPCKYLVELKSYLVGTDVHLGCLMYGLPEEHVEVALTAGRARGRRRALSLDSRAERDGRRDRACA